ncbi:MAG: TIGR03617 family F420-dependent LLM class oxidoreductase, partial [Acidimicrobiia bacterium]|nr:TIGR03617 family F420-dependent LLM class oxidoreductase [Acidimicrobiia bacterium]
LDARLRTGLAHAADDARDAEEVGFDGAWSTENQSDPFLPLAVAAEHTARLELGPSVAIAFARTPMTVAHLASDLQRYSQGRFVLGLGSQIKPHIEKRFSMPWSRPAARMREFVLALRAIWATWERGEPLAHRGEFYTHTLMTPAFTPPENPFGPPPVYLAGVGPLMTEVAGEVADGLLAHPFLTERYLHEVTVPALEAGLAKAGKAMDGFEIGLSAFVALDEADVEAVRRQISFYGSTPAYRPVLDLHGWGELQTELNALSKQGRWDDMVGLVDDEVLAAMCSVGNPAEVAADLRRRYGRVAQRIRFNRPGDVPPPRQFAELVDAMRAAEAGA